MALRLTTSNTVFIPSERSSLSQFILTRDAYIWQHGTQLCRAVCTVHSVFLRRSLSPDFAENHGQTILPMLYAFYILSMLIAEEEKGRKSKSLIAVHNKYSIFSCNSHAVVCPSPLGAAWKWTLTSATKYLRGWLESIWEEYSCWNAHHQLPQAIPM